jgi:hypothetical protein
MMKRPTQRIRMKCRTFGSDAKRDDPDPDRGPDPGELCVRHIGRADRDSLKSADMFV